VRAMSVLKSSTTLKTAVAAGAIVLGLAMSTGSLTASSLSGVPSDPPAIDAARAARTAVTSTELHEDSSPNVFARAARTRDAIGFPVGPRRSGRHVHDGLKQLDYDEVAEVDASGQPLALTQFDNAGLLVAAIRFDAAAPAVARISGDGAATSALSALTACGVSVGGQARTDANDLAGGWDVHWPRSQAGFAVRGDEARVHVWPDGRIASVARVEHTLAAAPARQLTESDVHLAVTRQMDTWFGGSDAGYVVDNMDVEWVGPNAAFDSTKVGAAPQPYRLAWVANIRPTGSAAGAVRLITLYVDAGDGTVIGGDVVE